MATDTSDYDFRFGVARRIIYLKEPYMMDLVLSLVVKEGAEHTTTLCTTQNCVMYYNPAYIDSIDDLELAFAYAHEAWHRGRKTHERIGTRDPKLWNIAADAAINGDMKESGWKLPTNVVLPETMLAGCGVKPDKLPVGLMAEDYYDEIIKRQKAQPKKQGQQSGQNGQQGQGQAQPQQGQGQGQNAPQKGNSGGSGAGQKPGQQQGQGSGQGQPQGGVGRGHCGGCAGNPGHEEPKNDPDGRTQNEIDDAGKRTAQAIQDYASGKGRGKLPAGYLVWAGAQLTEPKADWRERLSCLVGNASAWRTGRRRQRFDRPNRRCGEIAEGDPLQPRRRSKKVRAAIIIDTSGSMGSGAGSMLANAVKETAGILEALNADTVVMTCDAQVHGIGTVRETADIMPLIKGGGGSSFWPAFAKLAELQEEGEGVDVAIFLTDGDIAVPPEAPDGLQVIWGCTAGHPPAEWGESVTIDS